MIILGRLFDIWEIIVNKLIDEVKVEPRLDGFYNKITTTTEANSWIFYAGDIYNSEYMDVLVVLNEEIILAFNDLAEADKMEISIQKNRDARK